MANDLVDKYVRQAEETRLWGTLQFDFQDGQLTLIRREETFKPTASRPREQPTNGNRSNQSPR
jgi:hypothetical protein